MLNTRQTGQQTETLACNYLKTQGLILVDKNINYVFGELDLVMLDGQSLVFIEVRFRNKSNFGSALESVTRQKQSRLTRAAQAYLQQHRKWRNTDCRFDVVSLSGNVEEPQIEWFKNLW